MKSLQDYLSDPAKLAVLGYGILLLSILLPLNQMRMDETNNVEKKYNLGERMFAILFMLIPIVVSILTINCISVGSAKGGLPCSILSWVNAISVFLWSALVFVFSLYLMGQKTT